ncbi:sensor histidine kinase [Kitasatospora kifunensis]|uniref:histidine kinase n=1 Tax=Kitasatospora kifunensis TaxID=58351 RepID=A0A7W7VW02_KITKI|nr:histidine kinase [Kitasatospora kifunensis]MBB4924957.1 signal transduction histidine kinase [Kitasatospora kifunensis]
MASTARGGAEQETEPATADPAQGAQAPAAPAVSARIALAQVRIDQRRTRQLARLRPLSWLLLAAVAVSAWTSSPAPGLTGRHLAVSLALLCYAVPMALAGAGRWPGHTVRSRIVLILIVSVASLTLTGLVPSGILNVLPVSGAVMIGFLRLDLRPALLISGTSTVLLVVLLALTVSHPVETITSSVLLCVVLGVTARLIRQSREGQERTELLFAELEDAWEAETRAAAGAERARIARELHDVLAQSLSALAIQLEGARKLAERDQVAPLLQQVINRSVELTREGLNEARQAVGALRGDRLPGLADVAPLVERSARDLELSVELSVLGTVRPGEPQAEFALYRGVQEALTNVARYARGSRAEVVLDYRRGDRVAVTVSNTAGSAAAQAGGGGGNGLRGMRERVERVGGTAEAGLSEDGGWRVAMEVPA